MRKVFLMLAVSGTALAVSAGAWAMPASVSTAAVNPVPSVSAASVQQVQYYRREDRRHWRREHRRDERWRRRHYRY